MLGPMVRWTVSATVSFTNLDQRNGHFPDGSKEQDIIIHLAAAIIIVEPLIIDTLNKKKQLSFFYSYCSVLFNLLTKDISV